MVVHHFSQLGSCRVLLGRDLWDCCCEGVKVARGQSREQPQAIIATSCAQRVHRLTEDVVTREGTNSMSSPKTHGVHGQHRMQLLSLVVTHVHLLVDAFAPSSTASEQSIDSIEKSDDVGE